MANVSVYNMEGKEVGKIDLNDAVFGVEVNEHLVHMAVVQQLANNRQGTQKAKTRGEVRGGGRKPWRQKGTGHARQGSTRSPQWKGGGMVFAPVPRDYSFKLNKKEKRAALKSALSSRVLEDTNGKSVCKEMYILETRKSVFGHRILGVAQIQSILTRSTARISSLTSARNYRTTMTL